jgi:hypothetical protein
MDTGYLDSHIDLEYESNNPLNDLNDLDPDATGSIVLEGNSVYQSNLDLNGGLEF